MTRGDWGATGICVLFGLAIVLVSDNQDLGAGIILGCGLFLIISGIIE